jgi:DNA-binding transcriptional MocR family regulator
MEVAKAAQAMAARGGGHGASPMIYLNIGEPDFTAPPLVQEAAPRAIARRRHPVHPGTGLAPLRERISAGTSRFGVQVPARRIVVTAGASAALQLACLALIEAGDEILMPDPSYPCNRHFVSAAEGNGGADAHHGSRALPAQRRQGEAAWGPRPAACCWPRPPTPPAPRSTRTSFAPHPRAWCSAAAASPDRRNLPGPELRRQFRPDRPGHGRHIISINSFSKYFNMTGWRLGWLVVPDALVPVVERLAQNLFICPSTVAQHAALACFEPESIAEYERRRAEFKARRDYFIPAAARPGPDGAGDARRRLLRLGRLQRRPAKAGRATTAGTLPSS